VFDPEKEMLPYQNRGRSSDHGSASFSGKETLRFSFSGAKLRTGESSPMMQETVIGKILFYLRLRE